ncbi:MAG: hypothetical protein GY940_35365 [bacterium]|nr:hypothetical protein [bacterium]
MKQKKTIKKGEPYPKPQVPKQTLLKKEWFEAQLQEARVLHRVHRTALRILFQSDLKVLYHFELNDKEEASLTLWTAQARDFYRKTLNRADILDKMTQFGIQRTQLELCLAKIKDLEANKLWRKQTHEEWVKGEYNLQDKMNSMMEHYEKARDAVYEIYKDQPEVLVEFGLAKNVEEAIELRKKTERQQWKLRKLPATQSENGENNPVTPVTPKEETK